MPQVTKSNYNSLFLPSECLCRHTYIHLRYLFSSDLSFSLCNVCFCLFFLLFYDCFLKSSYTFVYFFSLSSFRAVFFRIFSLPSSVFHFSTLTHVFASFLFLLLSFISATYHTCLFLFSFFFCLSF